MTAKLSRLHAIARGRVQGVGYRWFILAKGRALGLNGQVRNLSDGTVEVSAEGPKTDLESLVQAIKEGPDSSDVTGTSVEWETYAGNFSGFEIAPTR
jgi:acylphosphatase